MADAKQYFLTSDNQLKAVGPGGLALAKDSGWKPLGADLDAARAARDVGSFGGIAKTAAETAGKGAFDAITGIPRAVTATLGALTNSEDPLEHVSGDHFFEDLAAVGGEAAGHSGEASALTYKTGAQRRELANPATATAGYVGGQIGSAIATGGLGSVLGATGEGLAGTAGSALTKATGGGLAARLGGAAVSGAIEGAPLMMTQAQHDAWVEGKKLTAEQNVANLGMGALFGGTIGAGTKGLGEVFGSGLSKVRSVFEKAPGAEASGESSLRQVLRTGDEHIESSIASTTGQPVEKGAADYVRDAVQGKSLNEIQATEQGAAARELRSHINGMEEATNNLSPEWREAKAANVAKTIDKSEEAFARQSEIAQDQVGAIRDRIAEMKADPAAYGDRATLNKLERHVTVAEREVGAAIEAGRGEDMFVALDNLKRKMGPLAAKDGEYSVAADKAARVEAAELYNGLRDALEHGAWGEAGVMQKNVNGAYQEWLGTKGLFNKRFMTETGKSGWKTTYGVDPGKVEPYVQGLGLAKNDLTHGIIEQHIESTKKLADALAKAGEMTPEKAAELASIRTAAENFSKTIAGVQGKAAAIEQAKTFMTKASGGHGNAAILGGVIHGPIGAAVGAVYGAVENPARFLAKRIQFEQAASKVSEKMSGALDAFFKPGALGKAGETAQAVGRATSKAKVPGVLGAFGGASKTPQMAFQKRADELQQAAIDNGSGVRSGVARHFGDLATTDPDAYAQATVTASRALAFLQGKMPEYGPNTKSLTPMTAKIEPSKVEIQTFATYWNAVNDPRSVVESLKNNMLQPEQVEAIQSVYPKLYEWMQTETLGRLRDMDAKGEDVPVRKRMMLDTFLDLNGAGEPSFAPAFGATFGPKMGDTQGNNEAKPRPGGATGSISGNYKTHTSMMIGG